MPTYSYKCTQCDTAFDIHQEFTDDALTVCPTCGGRLRKVFSSIGVTFNGPGFYSTDSRKTPSAGESAHPSPSGESASTSSESAKKSAPKSEKKAPAAKPTKTAAPAPVS